MVAREKEILTEMDSARFFSPSFQFKDKEFCRGGVGWVHPSRCLWAPQWQRLHCHSWEMVSRYLHFYWCSKLQIAFCSSCLCLCVEERKKSLICSGRAYINHGEERRGANSSLNKTSGRTEFSFGKFATRFSTVFCWAETNRQVQTKTVYTIQFY